MKKAIIIIISILLVLTVGSIFALNKLGNAVIDTLIDSEISSLIDIEDGVDVTQNADAAKNSNPDSVNNNNKGEDANSPGQDPNVNNTGKAGEPDSSQKSTDNNVKANSNNGKKEPTQVITVQKAEEIKDQVTAADKMTAATLVLKRLSGEDISTLKNLMAGGLTAEKKKEAVKIAYARFNAEEIARIKELYHKYMK